MQPESDAQRAARHAATVAAYRSLVDPAAPPRAPHLLEHHFAADEAGDVNGLAAQLEAQGFAIDTLTYDPTDAERAWSLVVVRIELLEERRVLALSDQLDGLARQHGVTYEGWLTRVEQ